MKPISEIEANEYVWDMRPAPIAHSFVGYCKLPQAKRCSLIISYSEGNEMDHVSVSPMNRFTVPTWEDMCALKKALGDWNRDNWTDAFTGADAGSDFADIIDHAKTIDSAPVVHAHWVYGYTFQDGQYRKCSACMELIKVVANDGNFCGHCGAKMDGDNENG